MEIKEKGDNKEWKGWRSSTHSTPSLLGAEEGEGMKAEWTQRSVG